MATICLAKTQIKRVITLRFQGLPTVHNIGRILLPNIMFLMSTDTDTRISSPTNNPGLARDTTIDYIRGLRSGSIVQEDSAEQGKNEKGPKKQGTAQWTEQPAQTTFMSNRALLHEPDFTTATFETFEVTPEPPSKFVIAVALVRLANV